ncbi:MAG: hypothetical protein AAFR65_07600 [Pseudomonadota bacterium]
MKYFEWINALSSIYLEDSYVLEVRERASEIEFEMEFVLQDSHPCYTIPKEGEMYCYRRGIIRLRNCLDISWTNKQYALRQRLEDRDYCNIDAFYSDGDKIFIEGDWGQLSLRSDEIIVLLVS